jgi:hypothetical protein
MLVPGFSVLKPKQNFRNVNCSVVHQECLPAAFGAVWDSEFHDPPPEDPAFRLTSWQTRRKGPAVFMALLTAMLLFGSIRCSPAADYFINASGTLGDGSGSTAANAADASTPEKFYAIDQAQNRPGTVIVYAPGTYLMGTGFSMFSHVTHQGVGIDKTIIKVTDAASPYYPMWTTLSGTISGFQFFDATLDFNSSHQLWWNTAAGGVTGFSFSTANHCLIQRVNFINFGAKNQESFPIFFVNANYSPGHLGDNLIDSCIFTQPVPHGDTNFRPTLFSVY